MKVRYFINYLFVIILSSFISAKSSAQDWPKTEADFAKLPRYCSAKMGQKVPESEIRKWKQVLGPGYLHVHHVCAGLYTVNKLNSKVGAKDYQYRGALNAFQYTQRHAAKDFVLQPLISVEIGKVYLRLNRVPEAISEFQNAIQLKPTYTAPYAALSDFYIKIGLKNKAKDVLEEGLKYSPNSKKLKRRLAKL